MAMGCITIGSKGEGIDGIIEDRENGYLCRPGDEIALTQILYSIISSSKEELQTVSKKAQLTARRYSDASVATNYIKAVETILSMS